MKRGSLPARTLGFGSLFWFATLMGVAQSATAHKHYHGGYASTPSGGYLKRELEDSDFFIGGQYQQMRYGEENIIGYHTGSTSVSLSNRRHPSVDLFGVRFGAYLSDGMRLYLNYAKSSTYSDWFNVLETNDTTKDYALSADFLFGKDELRPFVGLSYGKLLLDREYTMNAVSVGDANSLKKWYWGAQAGLVWRPQDYSDIDVELGSRYMHLSGRKTSTVNANTDNVNGVDLPKGKPITITRDLQPALTFYAAVNYRF